MFPTNWRLACVAAVAGVVAACADTAPLPTSLDRPAQTAVDLQLTIPSANAGTARHIEGGSVITVLDSQPSATRGPRTLASRIGSASMAASEFADAAVIFWAETKSYFTRANGTTVALGEGGMEFLANRAEQAVNLTVTTPAGSLLSGMQVESFSTALPVIARLYTYARIPVASDCGYGAMASTNHKAWHKFPLPPFTEFGHEYATTMSGLDQLPACSTQIKTTTGTGGEGDSRIIDSQWQICYWLVWYDSSGVELWREFLYCTTM